MTDRKDTYKLRSLPGPYPVVLSANVLECFGEADVDNGGRESSVGLFGSFRGGEMVLEDALLATKWSSNRSSLLDYAKVFEMEAHFQPHTDWTFVGDAHVHPEYGVTAPSAADCESWANGARANTQRSDGRYVGIILTPGGEASDKWIKPVISAYLAELRDDGHVSINPANLVIEERPRVA